MSRFKKAGVLLVLLALPAFFFLFLKLFGTNHYDLPAFHPLTDETGAIVMNRGDTVYYQIQQSPGLLTGGDSLPVSVLENRITAFLRIGSGEVTRLKGTVARLTERLEQSYGLQWVYDVRLSGEALSSLSNAYVMDSLSEDHLQQVLKIGKSAAGPGTIPASTSLVLVDGNRRLRGYYDLSDPEEIERAVAEIKILQYQVKVGTDK